MALSTGAFPYDINNLLGGAARVLITPFSGSTVPTSPADVFAQVSPYAAKAPWVDIGATKDAFQYGRNIAVGGYEIQQVQGNVIEEITSVARTVQVSLAEIGPAGLELIEQQPTTAAIAAAAGSSAYTALPFGTISDLERYRVAFVARRSQASGLVVEGAGGLSRGRFVVGVGYNVAVSADNVQLGLAKGELSAAQVTFAFFPDPTETSGEEYGSWYDEADGTIAP